MYKSEKRLYVTADRSRVVEEDDPQAAMLLVAEGGEIQDEEAARLGLTGKKKAEPEPVVVHSIAADPEPDPKPARRSAAKDDDEDDAAEAKAVSGPPANKAQASSGRKVDEDK
jgi:hypothetical protein